MEDAHGEREGERSDWMNVYVNITTLSVVEPNEH